MRKMMFILSALLLCMVISADEPDSLYVPGKILFKVINDFTTINVRIDGIIETEQQWFNELAILYQITELRKLYVYSVIPSMQKTYHCIFPDSTTLETVIADFENRAEHVTMVYKDVYVSLCSVPNDEYYEDHQWPLQQVNGEAAYDALEDVNLPPGVDQIIVALVDTGVDYNHPDLENNILKYPNGSPVGFNLIWPEQEFDDDCGHGTLVAGIIAAETNNEIGIASLGGNNNLIKIMPIKIFDSEGGGTASIALEGLNWAVENPTIYKADVVNMSWMINTWNVDDPNYLDFQEFFDYYSNVSNCAFIAPVGNHGFDQSNAWYNNAIPARLNNVFSVAATNINKSKADYSSWASWVDISAPGGSGINSPNGDDAHNPDAFLSTLPSNDDYGWYYSTINPESPLYGFQLGNWYLDPFYDFVQGTSTSTAMVSSLVGLLKAKYYNELEAGTMDIDDIYDIIKLSAMEGDFLSFYTGKMGAGIIDAGAALNNIYPYYKFTMIDENDIVISDIVISDTDRDFIDEMIILSSTLGLSQIHFYNHNDGFQSIMRYRPMNMTPAIGDIDSDGNKEIFIGDNQGYIIVIDNEGNTLYESDGSFFPGESIYHTAVIEDVTGDGQHDVILSSNPYYPHYNYSAINIIDFSSLNPDPVSFSYHEEDRRICNAISVVDLNNDSKKEIIAPSITSEDSDGEIRIYNFSELNEIELVEVLSPSENIENLSAPIVADLNEDGSKEIIITYLKADFFYISFYDFTTSNWYILDIYIPYESNVLPEITVGEFLSEHDGLEFTVSTNSSDSFKTSIYGYEGYLLHKNVENEILRTLFVDYNDNTIQDMIVFTKNSIHFFPELNDEDLILRNQNYSSTYRSIAVGKLEDEYKQDIYYITEDGRLYSMNNAFPKSALNEYSQYRNNSRNTGSYYQPIPETLYSNLTVNHDVIIDKDVNIVSSRPLPELVFEEGIEVRFEHDTGIHVKGKLTSNGSEDNPVVISGLCSNETSDYWEGIEFTKSSESSIERTVIQNANKGISYNECFQEHNLDKNEIKNNEIGISFYNSSFCINENYIWNNEYGVECHKEASPLLGFPDPVISDNGHNGVMNNNVGIYVYESCPSLENGLNDLGLNEILNMEISHPLGHISAKNNWWGTDDLFTIKSLIDQDELVNFIPFCTDPQTNYSREDQLSVFQQAYIEFSNKNFYNAVPLFEQVIDDSLETIEDPMSVAGLFSCNLATNNMVGFKVYLEERLESELSEIMEKTFNNYLALSNRTLENYDDPIEHYENILLNNPTYEDSCYAVIDIGNAYLEANGRASGRLNHLVPESWKSHRETTEILLESIRSGNHIAGEIPEQEYSRLFNNYPNPFNPETTFSFSIPTDSNVNFSVYNIKGQKVKTLTNKKHDKGLHKLIWNGKDTFGKEVRSGVYMYKLDVNGKTKSIKKCLLLK